MNRFYNPTDPFAWSSTMKYSGSKHEIQITNYLNGVSKTYHLKSPSWIFNGNGSRVRTVQAVDSKLCIAFLMTMAFSLLSYGYDVSIVSNDEDKKLIQDYMSYDLFKNLYDSRNNLVFINTTINEDSYDYYATSHASKNDVVTLILTSDDDEYYRKLESAKRISIDNESSFILFRLMDEFTYPSVDCSIINLVADNELKITLYTMYSCQSYIPAGFLKRNVDGKTRIGAIERWNTGTSDTKWLFFDPDPAIELKMNFVTDEYTAVLKDGTIKKSKF